MIRLTHTKLRPAIFVGLVLLSSGAALQAQEINPATAGVAEREIARRQEITNRATENLAKGDELMAQADYEGAMAAYKASYDWLPDSVATEVARKQALDKFSKAAVKLAEQRISEGRMADARTLCEMVLVEGYNPGYRPAVTVLAHLEDPEYYTQTNGPKFIGNVEEVKRWLLEAEDFMETGRYDMAMKRTDQVLNVDKYNTAARRIQKEVAQLKQQYGEEAYDERRARMVWEVTEKWGSPVRKYGLEAVQGPNQIQSDPAGTERINRKLTSIIIPQIQFQDSTVREAIDFLKRRSKELDPEPDPNLKGVNIVLKLGGSGAGAGLPAAPPLPGEDAVAPAADLSAGEARITLALSNIPLGEALKYIASLANLKVKVEPFAVAIVPLSEPTDVLITKEFRVPPSFLNSVPGGEAGADGGGGFGGGAAFGGGGGAAGGGDASGAGAALAKKATAMAVLSSAGVTFPPGASAYYIAGSSKLIVRNTQENMDLIDVYVESLLDSAPKQVEIESKFVEITQNNTKELSFDWLLGASNTPGSDRVFVTGGTSGNTPATNNADFPFVAPGAAVPVGGNPVTAGNRSGGLAISGNAIDALLFGVSGASTLAPATLGVAGVFTDPQFQVVVRALNQMKGVDLLSSPKVTTKSGQRAVIEIIREFRYPTEFDPPQIPNEIGGGSGGGGGGVTIINVPVTPTTPTTFETRNTGVTLEVEPVVGPDGYTIDLNLVPQVVEFEGFINYGSPITAGQDVLGRPIVLTENRIPQPIFSTRKVTTSVSIWDGQTVALGGLIREDVQKVNDKVPLLGDIPIAGRLFRSKVDQHLKRNLTIFVTARLLDPAGQPLLGDEALEDEVVEPTISPENFTSAPPELPLFGK